MNRGRPDNDELAIRNNQAPNDTRLDDNPAAVDRIQEAGRSMNPSSPFSFERLLSGEDWPRWDTFPLAQTGSWETAQEDINMENREPVNHLVATSEAPLPDMGNDVRAGELLDWLVSTTLASELPELPSDDELMMLEQWDPLELYRWLNELSEVEPESLQEDLFFNVDHMAYEELLALGNRIGNASTGLEVQVVDENLIRRRYEASLAENEKCVICQEEFRDSEELSRLECGHRFHFECIKQWLMMKNECPLCKRRALVV